MEVRTKLRVGIVIKPEALNTDGGAFSYMQTLFRSINEFEFSPEIEIINILFDYSPSINLTKETVYLNSNPHVKFGNLKKRFKLSKTSRFLKLSKFLTYLATLANKKINRRVERVLIDNKIDLIYYLYPELNPLNYPFITTHWDVGHKSMDSFPETSMNRNYEDRENYYLYTLNKAFSIFCESDTGAKELQDFYKLYKNKVKVLPMFASDIIRLHIDEEKRNEVLLKYRLKPNKFFLYPAQFWASKNHYNLIIAFNRLIEHRKDPDLKLVLCGSDKGNLQYIQSVVHSHSLVDNIVIPGFVSNEELAVFYTQAIGLTMPTFLGPSNIPLIEAANFGCPVLCSDFLGHREIMGEHALYFDPANPNTIASAMEQVLDEEFRASLSGRALNHIRKSKFNVNKSLITLNNLLIDLIARRKAWDIEYKEV